MTVKAVRDFPRPRNLERGETLEGRCLRASCRRTDGGVEAGVGFVKGVGAGVFEGAVKFAQGVAEFAHDFAAQGAQRHGDSHFRDLLARRRLRLGKISTGTVFLLHIASCQDQPNVARMGQNS